MFTYPRPARRLTGNPVQAAVARPFKNGAWLLKLGQTVFVGLTVLSFALLFHGK